MRDLDPRSLMRAYSDVDGSDFFDHEGSYGSDGVAIRANVSVEEWKALVDDATPRVAENVRMRRDAQDSLDRSTAEVIESYDEARASNRGQEHEHLTLYLEEQPFDFEIFRYISRDSGRGDREAVWDERRVGLEESQSSVARVVERLGGTVTRYEEIINVLDVYVSYDTIPELLASWYVRGAELGGDQVADGEGVERRQAIGLEPDGWASRCYGGSGSPECIDAFEGSTRSSQSRVKFGVIEADNPINNGHLSFLTFPNGMNRIVDTDRCAFWFPSHRCINSATTSGGSHGTRVTSVLLGDLEDGQDPSITSTTARRMRGGIAAEAIAHYYSAKHRRHTRTALNEAVSDNGIDITNMSLSPDGEYCGNDDLSGVRDAIRNAENAGIFTVVSAGNDAVGRPLPQCSVSSYGAFPDSLTVGASENPKLLADLQTESIAGYSGRGSGLASLDGGRSVPTRFVDLVANGTVSLVAGSGQSQYASDSGTSFSAPTIAGAAGLLKDWIQERGTTNCLATNPYCLRVMMSAMGDGAFGTSYLGLTNEISETFGFGNFRLVDMDHDLGDGGMWGVKKYRLAEGMSVEWPVGGYGAEANDVLGWKFAALIDDDFYTNSPDVRYELMNYCPQGGGGPVVEMTAARYALKARMRLGLNELFGYFRGGCMRVRVTVEHAESSFDLYAFDYFYTEGRENHDMVF